MILAIITVTVFVALVYFLIRTSKNSGSMLLEGPPLVGAARGAVSPIEMPDLAPVEEESKDTFGGTTTTSPPQGH